ncbi:hypothetical protein F4782DRAFT_551136 [Xylaria castorea]|nr:hypothetical protein F4782DRAFT_551136 [Xylaria castorea]
MANEMYWSTFVERSKAGIVNTMMSTSVSTAGSSFRILSPIATIFPYASVNPLVSPARRIDILKLGNVTSKAPAVELLAKGSSMCYTMLYRNGVAGPVLGAVFDAVSNEENVGGIYYLVLECEHALDYRHRRGRDHVQAEARLAYVDYVLGHKVDEEGDEGQGGVPRRQHVDGRELDAVVNSDREHELAHVQEAEHEYERD